MACKSCESACAADMEYAAHNLKPHDCLVSYPHGGLVPWTCSTCGRVWTVRDSKFVEKTAEGGR